MAASFPILSFEQANPFFTGMGQAVTRYGNTLANQQQQMQNQIAQRYGMPMAEEAFKQAQYLTQRQAPLAKYAEDITLADLMKTRTDTRHQELINRFYPEIAAAEIAESKAKTETLPITAAGQYYSGLGRYNTSNYYNNPNVQLIRTLNTPEMQSIISSNPKLAKSVGEALANLALWRVTQLWAVHHSEGNIPQDNLPQGNSLNNFWGNRIEQSQC